MFQFTKSKPITKSKRIIVDNPVQHSKPPSPFSYPIKDLHGLPISGVMGDILKKKENSIHIATTTGTGKTFATPLFFADYYENSEDFHLSQMVVSLPLVKSATTTYDHVKRSFPYLSPYIGLKCGEITTHDFDNKRIMYATTRSAVNLILHRLRHSPRRLSGMIIIIDESHQMSDENRVLIYLCNWLLKNGFTIKVILMSATPPILDPRLTHLVDDSPIRLEETRFPITINYCGDDTIMVKEKLVDGVVTKSFIIDLEKIAETAANLIIMSDKQHADGHFIIFVSGILLETMIKKSLDRMKKEMGKSLKRDYCSISSTSSDSEREKLKSGKSFIVFATNSIESGITIDGTVVVVNTGVENQCLKVGRHTLLNTCVINKSSAKQRCGRAGRTCSGICYQLFSKHIFEKLNDHHPNQPLKDLSGWIMDFLGTGVDIPEVLDITGEQCEEILFDLERKGYVSGGRSTHLGALVRRLQFDSEDNKDLLTLLLQREYDPLTKLILITVITFVDSANSNSIFALPANIKPDEISEHYSSYYGDYQSDSDLESLLWIFTSMMYECFPGSLDARSFFTIELKNWCRDHRFNPIIMKTVFDKVVQCASLYRLQIVNEDWSAILGMCVDKQITPLLQRELLDLDLVSGKIFTLTNFDKYVCDTVEASRPKFCLNPHLYRNKNIVAFSCYGTALSGIIRKFTLGMVLPVPLSASRDVLLPVSLPDSSDSDSSDSDSSDDEC